MNKIWRWVSFKQSLTGLNSVFLFSYTSCHSKFTELSLPYYLSMVGGRIIGCIPFPKGISTMWNANSLVEDLNSVAMSISYDGNQLPVCKQKINIK